MSQVLAAVNETGIWIDRDKLTPRQAFIMAMGQMKEKERNAAFYAHTKPLLGMAGFSQKGCKRLSFLSAEENDALCQSAPESEALWQPYKCEVQTLLCKMSHARSKESFLGRPPFMGRPYITMQMADVIQKLASLRLLEKNGYAYFNFQKLRKLMWEDGEELELSKALELDLNYPAKKLENDVSIRPLIHLLAAYRDELIMPARLKPGKAFEQFKYQDDEDADSNCMESLMESYLEAISDINFKLHYDKPDLANVLDWFFGIQPDFDSNQIKLGWAYFEKSSEEWHQRERYEGYVLDKNITEYSDWKCIFSEREHSWLNIFPAGKPYKIVALTTPHQLQEESETMHHCVVTYIESCISGGTRIFSVTDARNGQKVATAQLNFRSGTWNLVQLKGRYNKELMDQISVLDDPLAIALAVLVKWYNENTPESDETDTQQ